MSLRNYFFYYVQVRNEYSLFARRIYNVRLLELPYLRSVRSLYALYYCLYGHVHIFVSSSDITDFLLLRSGNVEAILGPMSNDLASSTICYSY